MENNGLPVPAKLLLPPLPNPPPLKHYYYKLLMLHHTLCILDREAFLNNCKMSVATCIVVQDLLILVLVILQQQTLLHLEMSQMKGKLVCHLHSVYFHIVIQCPGFKYDNYCSTLLQLI